MHKESCKLLTNVDSCSNLPASWAACTDAADYLPLSGIDLLCTHT